MVVKILALLFVFFNLAACTPTYLPCRAEMFEIKYAPDWVCVEKAVAGQKMFTANGIDNRICCGKFLGRGHCWNEVRRDGIWFMSDMSHGKPDPGWPIYMYPEYEWEDIFYELIGLRELIATRDERKWMRSAKQ